MMLPDLIASAQSDDLKKAEDEYLRDRAAKEDLQAKSRRPGEMSLSKLLKTMYGDDQAPVAPEPTKPKSQEPTNVRPVEAFPPPARRR